MLRVRAMGFQAFMIACRSTCLYCLYLQDTLTHFANISLGRPPLTFHVHSDVGHLLIRTTTMLLEGA